jgi:hypothetical protein
VATTSALHRRGRHSNHHETTRHCGISHTSAG